MSSFLQRFLDNITIPPATSWLLGSCMEARGKQTLWLRTTPEVLKALRDVAVIQSSESSNRIEGVTVDEKRLLPLLSRKVTPRDRSEEEVFGYKKALDWIHAKHDSIEITPRTIKKLHKISQSGFSGDAGEWKKRNNEIIEILPNGRRQVRFIPVLPEDTPQAIEDLCLAYKDLKGGGALPDLLGIAAFILDFLCIHPFRDGNGRVSRLLTLLLLYQMGYYVGLYISLERIVENSKDSYYETLKQSSQNWASSKHDIIPFCHYFLGLIKAAYRELEDKVAVEIGGGKSNLILQEIATMADEFSFAELKEQVTNVSPQLVKKVLSKMKAEGLITVSGKGRSAKWRKIS